MLVDINQILSLMFSRLVSCLVFLLQFHWCTIICFHLVIYVYIFKLLDCCYFSQANIFSRCSFQCQPIILWILYSLLQFIKYMTGFDIIYHDMEMMEHVLYTYCICAYVNSCCKFEYKYMF